MEEKYGFLPLHERQIELEKQMRGIGFKRVEDAATSARQDERESDTPYGHRLLLAVVDPLSKRIADYMAEAEAGKPGQFVAVTATKLKGMNYDAVAFLTAKTVLDSLSINKMEQTVAHEVGRAVEEEARFQSYQTQNPALMDTIKRDHKKRGKSKRFTKRVLKLRLAKAGAEWAEWTEPDCIILGMKLISLFLQDEQQIVVREEMEVRGAKNHAAAYRLGLGPGTAEMIADAKELTALLTPGLLPTVVEPKRWRSPFGGAYWTGHIDRKAKRLVKTRNMNYMEDLRHVEMPHVYEGINGVQETAWKINKRVLDVMIEAWEVGREVGSLPSQRNMERPTTPAVVPPCKYSEDSAKYKEWIKTPDGKTWKAWRRMTTAVYEHNAKAKSRRLQAAKVMWVAQMFEKDEAIYFPHQLDFRSRVYAMPMFLHPQGPDYVRGLIHFAKGKAITTPAAKNWLAIHGANSYGIDKVSFHERVDWVNAHTEQIMVAAADPMSHVDWWGAAENPWQFLAFCFEWATMAASGNTFVSHLPVSLDGTCNGLQHFSAMLRDPVGGAAVNLTPSDKPQDIYAEVARKVNAKLATDADPLAVQWLSFGIDRKLTKRPVMILPYGGTQYACRKYVEEYVLAQVLDKGKANPFGDNLMDAVVYLARIIWDAIGETVVAAKDAMHWLRAVARLMAKQQLAIVWQTPVGFPVRQAYPQMRGSRVVLVVDGRRTKRRINIETDGLDKERQINGLSPNFVHSLDAAALMETVVRARHQGIRSFSFAMVHDSYGTLAADTEAMTRTLRQVFVDMYQGHDVLAELRAAVVAALPAGAEVPVIPKSGSLNINAVLESKFFFA
jgi:Autographiviridae RNA polymerase